MTPLQVLQGWTEGGKKVGTYIHLLAEYLTCVGRRVALHSVTTQTLLVCQRWLTRYPLLVPMSSHLSREELPASAYLVGTQVYGYNAPLSNCAPQAGHPLGYVPRSRSSRSHHPLIEISETSSELYLVSFLPSVSLNTACFGN